MLRSRSTAVERICPTITETERLPVRWRTSVAWPAARRAGPRTASASPGWSMTSPRARTAAAEVAQRAGDLGRDVLLEVDRPPRAAGEDADVADGQLDLARGLRVVVDGAQRASSRRGEAGGLPADVEGLVELARELVDRPAALERGLDAGAVAVGERVGDVVEHGGELAQDGLGGLPDEPDRVHGEDERAGGQRDAAADQRVDGAGEGDAVVGRLQRRDERGGDRGLLGEHVARAEQQRDRHREGDDERELPGARARAGSPAGRRSRCRA